MCKKHCKTQQDLAFCNLPPEPAEPPDSPEVVSASAFQTPPFPHPDHLNSLCLPVDAFGSIGPSFRVSLGCLCLPLDCLWLPLVVLWGPFGLPWDPLGRKSFFCSKCTTSLRANVQKSLQNTAGSSLLEFACGARGARGFCGSGVSKCFSDPPFHTRRGSG